MSQEENKITGLTSEQKMEARLAEIHRRLESAESQKAMKLLSIAMSHHDAMKFVKDNIDKKLNGKFK